MTSDHQKYSDIYQAIKDHQIPGTFNKDNTEFIFPTIKTMNIRGKELIWAVKVYLLINDELTPITNDMLKSPAQELKNAKGVIKIESGQIGGKVRDTQPIIISKGKNIGKKNATNVLTQAIQDAFSRYKKHNKNVPKKENMETNKRPRPMLPVPSERGKITEKDMKNESSWMIKLNGLHGVAYQDKKKVIFYSRTGHDILGMEIIRKEIGILFQYVPLVPAEYVEDQNLEYYSSNNIYFDGEFWEKGKDLAYISGQVRKEDDEGDLSFYIFDIFFPEAIDHGFQMLSKFRQKFLTDIFDNLKENNIKLDHVHRVENNILTTYDEIQIQFEKAIKNKEEGIVVRKGNGKYTYSYNNYHANDIVKYKEQFDDEFKVVGITAPTKGKDKDCIVFICEVDKEHMKDPTDTTFNIVPKMSLEDRRKLYKCLQAPSKADPKITKFEAKVKNKFLTITFQERSGKTGKPLRGNVVAFRTYEGDKDPIREIYKECGISKEE